VYNRKPTYVQEEVYQYLHDLSRFYQNMTEDLVRAKKRLHKVLQVTFPQLEISYPHQLESNIGTC
jgi:transposase